ncbi:MAG TPA: glycogen synthase GlgA [Acidimicrobiia bacterium]|nr:glycogen synthase GlgA [Acidimicrobiia bacterium]
MRVLFVASEVAPFAKTGGLADVASALPQALAARGHDVRVVMPCYDAVSANGFDPVEREPGILGFDLGPRKVAAGVKELPLGALKVTLVDVPSLYRLGAIYTEGPEEAFRFAVLSRAALELCRRWQWSPDVVHCNDWQTALVPLYLRAMFRADPILGSATSVFTIHNLAYQGVFSADVIPSLGIGGFRDMLDQESLRAGRIGILALGLMYADVLTTVSPTYAEEILTPELGFGLDDLLLSRADDLVGILNGIDTEVWNPAKDRLIPHLYSSKSLWRKEWNKKALTERVDLDHREGVPLFGIVSRLVEQKGIGLLPGPISGLLERDAARFVALGSGERRFEEALESLTQRFPGRAAYVSSYDEPLAHLIEAGADVFLMPSQFEPCGLNQMYSLAYGTPPLVRKTGGLADTVEHWDPTNRTGTGFVFEHFDEGGVWWALNEAMNAYADRKGWKRLQLNGMAIDNSWNKAAGEYEELYQRAVEAARASRVANPST